MSHWFDDLCSQIAGAEPTGQEPPRRSFLRGMLSTIMVSRLRRSFGWGEAFAVPSAVPVMFLDDQCARSWQGNKMIQALFLTQSGVTLQSTVSYDRATKVGASSLSVKKGETLIMDVQVTGRPGGASMAKIQYGPAIQGVKNATLTTTDGKTFRGSLDGRTVYSTANIHSISSAQFTDHKPAPVVTIDPRLSAILRPLGREVDTRLKLCKMAAVKPPLHHSNQGSQVKDYKPGQGGPNDPGDGWYEPGETYTSPDCNNCLNDCSSPPAKEGIENILDLLGDAVAIGAVMLQMLYAYVTCIAKCNLPGGGCCPVECGGSFTCCGRNDHCFRGDLCCPNNMVVCNNVCCGFNISGCAPDGTCGCPSGQFSCGRNCCDAGHVCCGGQCCPSGSCNNGICCSSPSHVCGAQCCAPFQSCCNGQCCDGRCINNQCCPTAQVCGNICCPPGKVCVNGTCFGCPPRSKFALPTFPCQSIGANGAQVGVCCPGTSGACCGGKCCGSNEHWCVSVNGVPTCSSVNPVH